MNLRNTTEENLKARLLRYQDQDRALIEKIEAAHSEGNFHYALALGRERDKLTNPINAYVTEWERRGHDVLDLYEENQGD